MAELIQRQQRAFEEYRLKRRHWSRHGAEFVGLTGSVFYSLLQHPTDMES